MLKEMLADLLPESAPKLQRARQYRNIVLFALLCANPLRIRMFAIMEFEKNLVRLSDGSWRLKFKKGAFKNRRALNSDYQVRVARQLWPMLDRYREEFHPLLAGSTRSRHVFLGSETDKSHRGRMNANSLGVIIEQLTELYVPGGIGFHPHSFRHLIATDIIKKDPRIGFFLAAIALHDKLETVETNYIHLKTSEFFEPVNTHYGEAWSLVFDSSREEQESRNQQSSS
jgi:integrase